MDYHDRVMDRHRARSRGDRHRAISAWAWTLGILDGTISSADKKRLEEKAEAEMREKGKL